MKFINEYISDEDKQRYDFSQIKRPPTYREPIDPRSWTISTERDVFLIWTAGGNEEERNAVHFSLWWSSFPIPIKLSIESSGHIQSHIAVTWSLLEMRLPKHLESSRQQIENALKSALIAYQVGGIGLPVASCETKFKF
jgi:hypothetical protein